MLGNAKVHRSTLFNKTNLTLDLMMIILCGIALYQGVHATRDLEWALGNYDFSRDLSNGQAILNGEYPNDPLYLGETMWYNPLVPFITAFGAWITHVPIMKVYIKAGVYLNILAPIAFFLLTTTLFKDRKAGLAATLGFLFLGNAPEIDPWIYATYSPWFLPMIFTQALFYLTFAALIRATRTQKWRWYIITGLLWGITFLGHTAPALLIGGFVVYLILKKLVLRILFHSPISYLPISKLLLTIFTSALVSMPFWLPIYKHYQFRVVNLHPNSWISPIFAIPNLTIFLKSNISVMTIVGLVGIICLIKSINRHDDDKQLLLLWGILATLGIAYEFIRQLKNLPNIVPGIHALLYFRSFIAVMFGYGLNSIIHNLTQTYIPKFEMPGYFICILTLLFVSLPGYPARFEFAGLHEIVQNANRQANNIDVINWIQNNTDPGDVFLAENSVGLSIVAPTGRKLVVVSKTFSNPYVDWKKREKDNNSMLKFLKKNNDTNREHFKELAAYYEVNYILMSVSEMRIDESYPLVRLFSNGGYKIYKLQDGID